MPDMAEYLQGEVTLLGHHLKLLTDLMPPIGETPERMARSRREAFVKIRGDVTAATVNWQALSAPTNSRERLATYAYTLVGETPEQADRHENALRDVLTTFVALDDDATILLAAEGLDGICKSCTFLDHCLRPDPARVDAQYLDLFEDTLAFARDKDRSLYASAVRTPKGLLTSAKAARLVMTFFAMGGDVESKNHYYADAISRQEQHGSMFARPGKAAVEAAIEKYYGLHDSTDT